MFLSRLFQRGHGFVEPTLGSLPQLFALRREYFGQFAALSFELFELTLRLTPGSLRKALPLADFDPLGLQLLLQGLEASQPSVELEVIASQQLPSSRQNTFRHPHATGDFERPRASGTTHEQSVGRPFRVLIELHRSVFHAVGSACRECDGCKMGSHYRHTATAVELFEQSASQGGPLERIGAGSEFVEEDKRFGVCTLEEARSCRHCTREGRKVCPDVLFVSDVAPDVVELRDHGSLVNRERDAGPAHQNHQTECFEDHSLAAGIWSRDHQNIGALRHPKTQRHHPMIGVAPFCFSKDLEPERVEALIEERVARCKKHQLTPFTRNHDSTFHGAPEKSLRLHRVKLCQHLHGTHQIVTSLGEETGNLLQDPLDLSRFTREGRREPVIQFDNADRLDKRGRTPRRNVEQETRELGASGRSNRQAIAVASHRWRCIGHNLSVASANGLELRQHVGSSPSNLPPKTTKLGRRAVGNRSIAGELRSHPVDQLPGVCKSTQNVNELFVFGRLESTTNRCHSAGESEQGDEVAGFGRRRSILVEPWHRLINPSQRQHAVFLNQVCDSNCQKSGSSAAGGIFQGSREITNNNAAHACTCVGRDQLENLIEFKLKSERTVRLSPHDVRGLEQTGAPLLGQLTKHLFTGLNHLPLPAFGRLFVETAAFHLGEDARLLALPLKAAQCLLEGLVVTNCDSCRHEGSPPLGADCVCGMAAS